MVAAVPAIRSSDANYTCPFHYYLRRRLGICPLYDYSEALSRGTWFHRFFEVWHDPAARILYQSAIDREEVSLRAIQALLPREARTAVTDMKQDAKLAATWFTVALDAELNPAIGTLRSFLSRFRVLDREMSLSVPYHRTNLTCRLDQLWYDEDSKTLWIPDLKSTSKNARDRALSCPWEFQTRLYTRIVTEALPTLCQHYGLPANTQLGGMYHIIIQKPLIRPSASDRPYITEEVRNKHGGITLKKVYIEGSSPDIGNYMNRCRSWYLGTDEYEDRIAKDGPPVVISNTPATVLYNEDMAIETEAIIQGIHHAATRAPVPNSFHRNGESMPGAPYSLFYDAPVVVWPELMRRHHLIVQHRD